MNCSEFSRKNGNSLRQYDHWEKTEIFEFACLREDVRVSPNLDKRFKSRTVISCSLCL